MISIFTRYSSLDRCWIRVVTLYHLEFILSGSELWFCNYATQLILFTDVGWMVRICLFAIIACFLSYSVGRSCPFLVLELMDPADVLTSLEVKYFLNYVYHSIGQHAAAILVLSHLPTLCCYQLAFCLTDTLIV